MEGDSIVLTRGQRNRLLELYRTEPRPCVRLRAHILLLLADGYAWAMITGVLYCSTATVARWKSRFEASGVEALLDETRGRASSSSSSSALAGWGVVVVAWVRRHTPRDFGYCRSRWCCATLLLVLWDVHHVRVSQETVRRWLHRAGLVWRRPRPVLGPRDSSRPSKLRKIRELLRDLPPDEAAVFQDEVDLNLNPKIGCAWMPRGEQAEVVTPGTNVKRYLAGSMSWRSGELVVTQGSKRDTALFLAHLDDLRRHLRHYKVIHVICDNAHFHKAGGSGRVASYLATWGHRIKLHYLPTYSPNDNPIERVWWHLHEQVTRNHRCADIEELVKLTLAWLDERGAFKIEGAMYQRLKQRLRDAA
jgi:transposase